MRGTGSIGGGGKDEVLHAAVNGYMVLCTVVLGLFHAA